MKKCSNTCAPTCDFCIYASNETLEINSRSYFGEPVCCKLHPEDKNVSAAHYCDDFQCFRYKEFKDPEIEELEDI